MSTLDDEYRQGYTDEELKQAAQGPIQEEFPTLSRRLEFDSEEQLNHNRRHNAWIIIGRDRPAGLESGYGKFAVNKRNRFIDGRKSSTIDIGVGRYSGFTGSLSREKVVGNHIQYDASRIYISQKTNIDENFLLKEAGTLEESIANSAIGLKSDVIRLAARENIKIVANTGDPSNSAGFRSRSVENLYGIQLITGIGENATGKNVQGIVKADNLASLLDALLKEITSFVGLVGSYVQLQDVFNKAIAEHKHGGIVKSGPNGSLEVDASTPLLSEHVKYTTQKLSQIDTSLVNLKYKFGVSVRQYLEPNTNPKKYIGSIYNKTN